MGREEEEVMEQEKDRKVKEGKMRFDFFLLKRCEKNKEVNR